jgi:Lon protease-like protein
VKFPFAPRAHERAPIELPLFPLKTVLFPGGVLPLKVFEQRYIGMAKACLKERQPFGVVLITQGAEVAQQGSSPAEFAPVGTLATIASWDMPELGILHVTAAGGERFQVRSHELQADGLVVARVATLPAEDAVALPAAFAPLVRLLEVLAEKVGPRQFPETSAYDDASWVGYRLAELLPLPLSIKQGMLEINDADVRLGLLSRFLKQQGLI